jgi:hypothetical protein
MMQSAKLTDEYQGLLWAEAVHTSTRLTNSTINSVTKNGPDNMFYNDMNPRGGPDNKLYKQFGRVGWVTARHGITSVKKSIMHIGSRVSYAKWHRIFVYMIIFGSKI